MTSIIEARELRKDYRVASRGGLLRRLVRPEYRKVVAVDGVELAISANEAVGFVGPNGAGKSTTIKMLTGILAPTSGIVAVKGIDPHRQRQRNAWNIGVVFGHRTQLWWDLPARDSFDLLAKVYRLDPSTYRASLKRFCDLLELDPFIDVPVRNLSLGQRMRAEITAALLHDPEIVYLDEPTIGLDLMAKQRIWSFLEDQKARRGTTILFTSHDLHDIERSCERIVVIDRGRIIYDGRIDAVRRRFGQERNLVVTFPGPAPALDLLGVTVVKKDGAKVWLRLDGGAGAGDLVQRIVRRFEICDLTVEEPSIERVVQHIYEISGRAEAGR